MKIVVFQPGYPAAGTLAIAAECMAWMSAELARLTPGEADLVLLPEYANTPGLDDPTLLRACADELGRSFLLTVAATAGRLQCLVAVGVITHELGQWFNRTLVFNRSGQAGCHYDKIHLTEVEETHLGLTPGSGSAFHRHGDLRLGFATCFDQYFSEHFAALASLRPDLILCPSYQRSESAGRIRTLAQARALDTGSYLIRSAYAMIGAATGGHSLVAAPNGSGLMDTGETPGGSHLEIDLDLKFTKPASHGQPPLDHRSLIEARRRPDTYRRETGNNE